MKSARCWLRHCVISLHGFGLAACSTSVLAYELNIVNKTEFTVVGEVSYSNCPVQRWGASPMQSFVLPNRGQCLITGISAFVPQSPSGGVAQGAHPYVSKGTNSTEFEVARDAARQLRVLSTTDFATGGSRPTLAWTAVAAGKPPPTTALKGGMQRFGGRAVDDWLPVCRAQRNGVWAIGNAAPFYSHAGGWSWTVLRCYVSFDGGSEQELAEYEVLMPDTAVAQAQVGTPARNAIRWVAADGGGSPEGAFDGGPVNRVLHTCRAQHSDGGVWVRVGQVGSGGCNYAYGGQQRQASSYEVLVVGPQSTAVAYVPRVAAQPDRQQMSVSQMTGATGGTYKINSVSYNSRTGQQLQLKKTPGGIWEMTGSLYANVNPSLVRPYTEVERNDDQIVLFGSPWSYPVSGSSNVIRAGAEQVVLDIKAGVARVGGSNSNLTRVAMAEPDTVWALTLKLIDPSQAGTFWKRGSPPPLLLKGSDGQFGDYRISGMNAGWLELYRVIEQPGNARRTIQFLQVDLWGNRVWELLGFTDQATAGRSAENLRELARNSAARNGWAEAYELTNAAVFSGSNIGAATARLAGGQQMAWTLREEISGGSLRWEELKNDVVARQSGVAETAPVGRMLTEVSRNATSLTLSGSELGSPLVIDWIAGQVSVSGRKVADFLTGEGEYLGQRKLLPRPVLPGISPGFQFVNKTDWPVMVKIGQVGCLYHGVVPPRGIMTRNTGAVWFTLSASWSGDGKDLTSEQIWTECAAPVALTTLGVIAAAATGGTAAGAVALGASAAATAGAATTAVQFMQASGASQGQQDAVAAGIYVVAAAVSGGVGAFQVVSARMAAGTTAAMARSAMATQVATGAAREALMTMRDEAINYAAFAAADRISQPTEQDMGVLQSWFDKEITLAGQYAGYPWPWKMKDRVMPQYEITGGPRVDTLKDGSKLIRKGAPFAFRRVN